MVKPLEPSHDTSSKIFVLWKKVILLTYDLKIVNSSKNLDLILSGQTPYLHKVSLDYVEKYDEESIRNMLEKPKFCHFFFKYGHSSKECFLIRKAIRKKKSKS